MPDDSSSGTEYVPLAARGPPNTATLIGLEDDLAAPDPSAKRRRREAREDYDKRLAQPPAGRPL